MTGPAVGDRVRTLAGSEGRIVEAHKQADRVSRDGRKIIRAAWLYRVRLDGGQQIVVTCSPDELRQIGGER